MRLPFLLAALLLSASTARPAVTLLVGEAVAKIPVVKTISELSKVDTVVANDAEVHIGIQADTCDAGNGLLLYVLQPSPAPAITVSREGTSFSRTGPVFVRMVRLRENGQPAGERALTYLGDGLDSLDEHVERPGKALYTCPIHISDPGKYGIQVYDVEKNLLAKTTITVNKQRAQLWFPVMLDGTIDAKTKSPIMGLIFPISMSPNWSPEVARAIPLRELPQFLPPESSDFHIEADAGDINAVIKRDLHHFAQQPILVRVWVNGEPIVDAKFTEPSRDDTAIKTGLLTSPVKFTIRPGLSDLGVRPADKVEIQMAYCTRGYLSDSYASTSLYTGPEEKNEVPILISNKIILQQGRPSAHDTK